MHVWCYLLPFLFTTLLFSPWGYSAPVTMTTTAAPDDFTFPLDNTGDDTGSVIPSVMNQGNPFNLSDLSSTLSPSLMAENTASSEVSVLYIEALKFLLPGEAD